MVQYSMNPLLANLLTSLSVSYNTQSDPDTVVSGMQISSADGNILDTGALSADTLLPAIEVVEFRLETVIDGYMYSSAPYILDPSMVIIVCVCVCVQCMCTV